MANYDQLYFSDPNQIGDIVICFVDENENGAYDRGEWIAHSATVSAVDDEGFTTVVTGKRGIMDNR